MSKIKYVMASTTGNSRPYDVTLLLNGPNNGTKYANLTKDEAIALIEKLKEATK